MVSGFLFFRLLSRQNRGKLRHQVRRDWMEKDSALYQLMDVRMNGVMNGIVSSDGEYQEIIRRFDECSGKLEKMDLPKEMS